jgi:hypothetical protein
MPGILETEFRLAEENAAKQQREADRICGDTYNLCSKILSEQGKSTPYLMSGLLAELGFVQGMGADDLWHRWETTQNVALEGEEKPRQVRISGGGINAPEHPRMVFVRVSGLDPIIILSPDHGETKKPKDRRYTRTNLTEARLFGAIIDQIV